MNVPVVFDYPFWLVLLCLLCGLTYSGILYYRNNKDSLHPAVQWMLAVFRFFSVSIIAFLLLAPLIERLINTVEKPYLVFLQDNTRSLVLASDSSYLFNEYLPEMNSFVASFPDDVQTRIYTFGEKVQPADTIDFSERVTNMSAIFSELDARYSNRNLGAVILAGDGIYNRGINPVYAAAMATYPVYTLALGDTVTRKDLILKNVRHNRMAYLGNLFPVEVEIEALKSRGLSSHLVITHRGEEVYREQVNFTSDHHTGTYSLHLEASEAGMQRFTAEILPIEDEVSLQNNARDFYVDVLDTRQNILIMAAYPHPDVAALKHALEANEQYEVESVLFRDFDGSAEAYDLMVLHQLPSVNFPARTFFEQAARENSSLLFIVGGKTDINAFNAMQSLLNLQPRSPELVESLAEVNTGFLLFSIHEQAARMLGLMPPLYVPFANYRPSSEASVMLYQKIGQVVTEQPLVLFSSAGQSRTGIIAGEGLWRWRLNTLLRESHPGTFDDLISRIVNYLALREDRSLFRVEAPTLLFENEALVVEAELYNRSYELINEPEVHLFITNEEGVELPYVMGRTSNAYRLDAGNFPPGDYAWHARVNTGAEVLNEEGLFTVRRLDLENLQSIADHALLFQLAENSGGKLFYPGQWDELRDHILNRDDIKPRLYSHKQFIEIINIKALFFIILAFLSIEWFLRKRSGGY